MYWFLECVFLKFREERIVSESGASRLNRECLRDRLSKAMCSLSTLKLHIILKLEKINRINFRQFKFSDLVFFSFWTSYTWDLGSGLNNNGRWKCDSFASPHPHPRKKKTATQSGVGVGSLFLVTLG